MRVIALVSLALALAASSMPLSARANGGVPATKEESTGTFGAVGSGGGNVVYPPGSGTASASGLENGSFGSSTASGSENGGGVYKSGSGAASGSGSGSFDPTRRSTTSPIPGDVKGAVSRLGGEAGSAVGGTPSTSNPVTHGALRSRDVAGSGSGAGQVVGGLGKVTGAAAGTASGAASGNGAEGTFKGAASGAVGSLGKSG